jgi:hypothetical protein
MPRVISTTPRMVAGWVTFCVFCNCAGWLLSAAGQLHAGSYVILFAGFGIGSVAWWRKARLRLPISHRLFRYRVRCKRLIPLGFTVLAAMAIVGGALYPPNNYDALAYRTPRVLNWLAAGHWYWIPTGFQRLNTRGCGFEWVTAPLMALFRSDRPLFLINAVSFLLLPGRVFSLLRLLGARGRVAWFWMLLFPTGYCYLLQAGSIGNDLYGATFAMIAIEFALRAGVTRSYATLAISCLAAGLMTASKAFNLLMLLPWGLAACPALILLLKRPLTSLLLSLAGLGASLVPTAILNWRFCGDWTGLTAENPTNLRHAERLFHVIINAVLIVLHNLAPPIFPFANAWTRFIQAHTPAGLSTKLWANFEPAGAKFEIGELQMEESAGIGIGVCLLVLFLFRWRKSSRPRIEQTVSAPGPATATSGFWSRPAFYVPLGTLCALGVFMSKSGLSCPARYLAPFYLLLLVPILKRENFDDRRGRIVCREGAILVFALAFVVLLINPSRPLWPARTVLKALHANDSPAHPLLSRAWAVYSVYGSRANAFEPALRLLPPGIQILGLVTLDDPETSLWRPFGSRRIIHVTPENSNEQLRAEGIRYILLSAVVLDLGNTTLQDWLARRDAELVASVPLALKAGLGPKECFIVRLR